MNNVQINSTNFRAGRTISWNHAVKYTNLTEKVTKLPFNNKPQSEKLLLQYIKEGKVPTDWVCQGIYKAVQQGRVSMEEAIRLLQNLIKKTL